jgi:hypothetical protein
VDGYLGYKAVAEVLYDAKANPNRLSIDFVDYKTINAERIELFCNARESEAYTREDGSIFSLFVPNTFAKSHSEVGQKSVCLCHDKVGGNYAHFWTWKYGNESTLTGNLLTACYLDPQDKLFFDEPAEPVVIYSHNLSASRFASGFLQAYQQRNYTFLLVS